MVQNKSKQTLSTFKTRKSISVFQYILNHKKGLRAFLDDGLVSLTTR